MPFGHTNSLDKSLAKMLYEKTKNEKRGKKKFIKEELSDFWHPGEERRKK
jgi:hypothetical protein